MTSPLSDPRYYLDNFQQVLRWITHRYADLLSPAEQDFLERFPALPEPSRALLVRMVMRKGELFRLSRLDYAEIGCTRQAVAALLAAGWVDAQPLLTLTQLFSLLTKPELSNIFRAQLRPGSASKAELLTQLAERYPEPRRLDAWQAGSTEQIFQLLIRPLTERFRLMFFGNMRQDWSEFVLADLGVYRYEKVDLDPASRAFQSRQDIDDTLHVHRCRELLEQGQPWADILALLPATPYANSWLETRRARLLFQLGRQCEQAGELIAAQAIYQGCGHPQARARLIRVLENLDQPGPAVELAISARHAPCNEAERQQVQRMLPRLCRKLGLPAEPERNMAPPDRIDLLLPRPREPRPVEQLVAEHLSEPDGPVFYVENTLINGLFGLLCWEAIFAAVPGAFFHPFHRGPADLLSEDFHRRRAAQFAACLARLDTDEYQAAIRRCHQEKFGLQSPFVAWHILDSTLLELALACLPARHLRLWFERIALDIGANRAGLPDLIQFWPAQQRYRMLEVKGPGDHLQDNQRRWLEVCAAHDMPVAVCYVQWAPV